MQPCRQLVGARTWKEVKGLQNIRRTRGVILQGGVEIMVVNSTRKLLKNL